MNLDDPATADTNMLLHIFPREIWGMVTSYIDDADDLQNLSKSCKFFEMHLNPKKVYYLFPSVWNILGKKYFENFKSATVYNELHGIQPSPYVGVNKKICTSCSLARRTQSFSGILKLRLVCKMWNNAIDKFFQNLSQNEVERQFVSQQAYIYTSYHWLHDTELMYLPNRFQCFIRHFQNSHGIYSDRNPLLSGKVGLFAVNNSAFLQQYGRHVNFLVLRSLDHDEMSTERKTKLYLEALEQCRNVKGLQIQDLADNAEYETNDELNKRLENEINLNPLPYLKNLNLLRFSGTPSIFLNNILHVNNHVTTLLVEKMHDEDDFDMYSIQLSNLKKLRISFASEKNFRKLVNWQFEVSLTHLDVSCVFTCMDFSTILTMISSKFGETLKNLKMDVQRLEQTEFNTYKLKFLRLERFIFKAEHIYSFEFLLDMKKTLKYLDIDMKISNDQDKKNAIEREKNVVFHNCTSCIESLRASVIWSLFPKLNEIKYMEVVQNANNNVTIINVNRDKLNCTL